MPFLAGFAQHCSVYENATSPAPWTMPSHASMFTGLYPSVHQATHENRTLRSELVTLAELLSARGYATAGFIANPNLSSAFNFHQGFADYFEVFRYWDMWNVSAIESAPQPDLLSRAILGRVFAPLRQGVPDKGARAINQHLKDWLDRRPPDAEPFFIFANYLEAHIPYAAPAAHRARFVEGPLAPAVEELTGEGCWSQVWKNIGQGHSMRSEDYEQLSALYDAELSYLDERFQELVEGLEARGLLENTLVLVTSDHGENLGEHGGLLNHSFSVHESVLHVPLLACAPNAARRGHRSGELVSTMSLFSTILDAADTLPDGHWPPALGPLPAHGEEATPTHVIAEYALPISELSALSLVPGVHVGRYAVRQRAIRTAAWKLISRSDGRSELFDLRVDPGEVVPLKPESVKAGRMLNDRLESWEAGVRRPAFADSTPPYALDESTQSSLRSLGYIP